ncbi:hypothetical protein [Alcanivorax sp.]|uniref:hypothetical protein n=1 Tax=Alcanivorax sp. TaxID=1872427 RepID=UPI0025BF2944|nr:hypothetical protein [Alcanivorax sp.]
MEFFVQENRKTALENFLRKSSVVLEGENENFMLEISREIVGAMVSDLRAWDDRCEFNIEHVGQRFFGYLDDFDSGNEKVIEKIFVFCYRFLCEFDFFVGPGKEMSMDLRSIKDRIQYQTELLSESVRSQVVYASYIMPANMIKQFVNHHDINSFRGFSGAVEEAKKLKGEWNKEIEDKKKSVQVIGDKLKDYEVGFNFVGLYQGFSDLAKKKILEARWLLGWLVFMGVAIVAPLVAEVVFVVSSNGDGFVINSDNFFLVFPLISIEIVLIYFFRVVLFNYRSVKGQVDQIELRKTLCQFIQSYAEYSGKIKKQDSGSLEKFENLIFSGVLSDPGKIPSTYDGLESLSELIKSTRG